MSRYLTDRREELWGYPSAPVALVIGPAITDRAWCDQCDRRVDAVEGQRCKSPFCKAVKAA